MKINGANSAAMPPGAVGMGAGGQMDAVSKDLQKQIENLQKQMQELSANQEMPMEAKMKKRQELQKQISDLEMQLRQHQMEAKREEAMKKRAENYSMDEMLGTKPQAKQDGARSTGMSAGSMEALISADASMKQAGIHGSTARKLEGKAGILKAEIDRDKGGPGDATAAKEEELAKVNQMADKAAAAQMGALAQANKTMQEAADDDQHNATAKAGDEEQKTASGTAQGMPRSDGKNAEETQDGAAAKNLAENRGLSEPSQPADGESQPANTYDVEQMGVAFSRGYNPLDVRL